MGNPKRGSDSIKIGLEFILNWVFDRTLEGESKITNWVLAETEMEASNSTFL